MFGSVPEWLNGPHSKCGMPQKRVSEVRILPLPPMKFSIIIPAHNEEKNISKTIKTLRNQATPRSDFEIIVINNNSSNKTSAIAKKAGADKIVFEKEPGTNIARQSGVKESNGEIIAFLDADSEAPVDWLKKIEKNLKIKGIVSTTGPYLHDFKGIKHLADIALTRIVLPILPRLLYVIFRKKSGVLIEGNFAVYRSALDKIGGLPPLRFYGDGAATAMLLTRRVGEIFYDKNLNVKSSIRRFEKHGLLKQEFMYAAAYFKMYFAKEYR